MRVGWLLSSALAFDVDDLTVDPRKPALGQSTFLRERGADDGFLSSMGAETHSAEPSDSAPRTQFRAGRFDVRKHLRLGLFEEDLDLSTSPVRNLNNKPYSYFLEVEEPPPSCGSPAELRGQSLRVCIPFGKSLSDPLANRFSGATLPIVVATVETFKQEGRFVVNLANVFFDHFEAVISRIDAPFKFWQGNLKNEGGVLKQTDDANMFIDWFAYGFAAAQSKAVEPQINEFYVDPLRPFLHTLPARAAGSDMLNPQTLLDPFGGDAHDNPYSARFAFGAPAVEGGRNFMHGFDVESERARQRLEASKDIDLWEITTKDKASVGITGAPGYQPTSEYAALTADEKLAVRAAAGKEGRAAKLDASGAPSFDARMTLPLPNHFPIEPQLRKRETASRGGFLTGASLTGGAPFPPSKVGKVDTEWLPIAPDTATDRSLERRAAQLLLADQTKTQQASYPATQLHAGEHRALQVVLPTGTAPILFEPGPGVWPPWAHLDNTTGAISLVAPNVSMRTREKFNVTIVILDAIAVDGLARRTIDTDLTVEPVG